MSVSGIGHNYYQNNVATNKHNKSRVGQFSPQKQETEVSAPEDTRQNANVQDIYKALKSTNPLLEQEDNGTQHAHDTLLRIAWLQWPPVTVLQAFMTPSLWHFEPCNISTMQMVPSCCQLKMRPVPLEQLPQPFCDFITELKRHLLS